ncbi:MAG: hypothetical protein QNJ13_01710 [Paracoccaceae bacterium]|nr:hypothetical protein [Paracoccaceae bacterium]
MAEDSGKSGFRLGVFDGGVERAGLRPGEALALGLAALWGVLALLYLASAAGPDTGPDPLRRLMAVLVIFLPAGLVWLAVSMRQTARDVEAQGNALQAALDQFRKAEAQRSQSSIVGLRPATAAARPGPETGPPVPPAGRSGTRAFATPAPPPEPDGDRPDAAPGLFAEPAPDPLPLDVFIRALHFPETAEDAAGFEALRRGLRHPTSGKVVQAAQDMLTALSQDGIYMDDLIPDRAKPETWRRFAKGERGRVVSELGGIRDRAALALSARRMREEPIFRDTAHHFLRSFDQTLVRIEPEATDAELARLSETRSARAFMLIGRVTGMFD